VKNGGIILYNDEVKSMEKVEPKTQQNRRKKRSKKQYIPLYLMALPAVLYIFINNYLPLYGMKIAFTELDYSKGIFNGNFVGFKNFKFLFQTDEAIIMIRNTILYNLAFIILGTLLSLAASILFNEIKNQVARKFYQSAIMIPGVISMVITSYLAFAFLSNETGFINNSILVPLGIEPISFYQEPIFWPFILFFVNNWKGIGFSVMMYTARIVSFPADYYEAAEIDGATKWQQIKNITLPLLKPVLILGITLSLGRMFSTDFGLFYQLPMGSGALYNVTTTIDTYSFRALMKLGDVTMSTATAVFQSVVGFVLLVFANLAVRKFSKDDAVF